MLASPTGYRGGEAIMAWQLIRRVAGALSIAAPALLCLAATAAAPAERRRWVLTLDLHIDKVNGAPAENPLPQHEQQSICDYAMAEETLQRLLTSNFGAGCMMSRSSLADGAISFAARCPARGENPEFSLAGTGTYGADTLHTDFAGQLKAGGDDLDVSGTLDGKRTGGCG